MRSRRSHNFLTNETKDYETMNQILPLVSLLSIIASTARACQDRLFLDSTSLTGAQDLVVTLSDENCDDVIDTSPSSSFLAIYPTGTPQGDIRGDANYNVWMWTCGSQFCRTYGEEATAAPFQAGTFSIETTNDHSWPLTAGSYQVHLVQPSQEEDGGFSSVAQSPVFEVAEPKPKRHHVSIQQSRRLLLAEDGMEEEEESSACTDDWIKTNARCYKEGEDFQVIFHNGCESLVQEDWFGFFSADACDPITNICEGEPAIWSLACHDDKSCHSNHKYRFKGTVYDRADKDDPVVLKAGEYRVALVADEVDNGEEPYLVRVLSEPVLVQGIGESCHLTERQS